MKMRLFAVLAVVLFGVALVSPVAAQTLALSVNVPFEFSFAGNTLPAGQYMFHSRVSSPVLSVRSLDGLTSVSWLGFQVSTRRVPTSPGRITFNRYGNSYFLSRVENDSTGAALQVPTSKAERELAKTVTAQTHRIAAVRAGL